MGGYFKFNVKTDKRQKIKEYKLEDYFYGKTLERFSKLLNTTKVEFWPGNLPLDALIYILAESKTNKKSNNYLINFYTTTFEPRTTYTFNFDYYYYYKFVLLLKLKFDNILFPVDMSFYKKNNDSSFVILFSSYISTDNYKLMFFFDNKTFFNLDETFLSISSIYPSFTWVERELSELNNIAFKNLKDGRRLLTDYTILNVDRDDYKITSYDIAVENLYDKMLHWIYIYSFLLSCALISLLIYNKNLLTLLLISEVIILLVFFLTIIIASFYNINFLLSFSFFLLIFGGLELALNLLLLML